MSSFQSEGAFTDQQILKRESVALSSQLCVPRWRQSGKMERFFGCDRRCESDPLIFRDKNNLHPGETFAAEIVEG